MRCVHEASLWEDKCFLTLTYSDEHLPPDGTLVKEDMSAFVKRLHNRLLRRRGYGVRFYGCGEYGETTGRPHYHLLVFGYSFPDGVFYRHAKREEDEDLRTSDECRSLWPYGHNVLGNVSFDSAAYVARYVVKKITGPMADDHYQGRVPEFTNMSRRPGIGARWFEKFGEHSYRHDSVVMNGKEVRPPRYYDGRYEVVDADALAKIKLKRRRRAMKHRADNTPERRLVRELVQVKRLSLFKRDV